MNSKTRAALVYNDEHFTQLFGSHSSHYVSELHIDINRGCEYSWQRMYWNKEFYPADFVVADMKPGVLAWRI